MECVKFSTHKNLNAILKDLTDIQDDLYYFGREGIIKDLDTAYKLADKLTPIINKIKDLSLPV